MVTVGDGTHVAMPGRLSLCGRRRRPGGSNMIEFKADCGHTVRAKDEDAGRVVRCSYCGRAANVPDQKAGDGLDFLFTDLQSQSAPTAAQRIPVQRRKGLFSRKARRPGEFNPFAVVVKLCYIAAILIVVIIVGRLWVLPLFKDDGLAKRLLPTATTGATGSKPQRGGGEAPADRNVPKPGLIGRESMSGLYVSSTPPGAAVFCIDAARAPVKGRISAVDGMQQMQAPGAFSGLHDGEYVVEVVLRWSDTTLNKYEGFMDFRRAIQNASPDDRRRRMQEYFIPDGASDVFVDQRDDLYLVRQYRGVLLRQQSSHGVRALFLPRILSADKSGLSVERLVNEYLPKTPAYILHEEQVRNELAFYGVKVTDEVFVMEALRRVGVFPYLGASMSHLLKIRLDDGTLAVETLADERP